MVPREREGERYGAKGRNRTADTAIFSRMLYRLSYLGVTWMRESRPAVYHPMARLSTAISPRTSLGWLLAPPPEWLTEWLAAPLP